MTMLLVATCTSSDMLTTYDYICFKEFDEVGFTQPGRLLDLIINEGNCETLKDGEWRILGVNHTYEKKNMLVMVIGDGENIGMILVRGHF